MIKVSAQTFARGCKRHIQLGKTLYRFLDLINKKYFTLILKMTILINCTGKFCYQHENFQNTEATTGGVLRIFTNFAGKHLSQRLFCNKVAELRPATLLEERLRHRCFPANFVRFLRTPIFETTVSQNIKAYI